MQEREEFVHLGTEVRERSPSGEPPAHYTLMHELERCRCVHSYLSPDGKLWCCNGKGALGKGGGMTEILHDAGAPTRIAQLVPTKSEADIAADIKRRMEAALTEHIAPIFDEAAKQGLQVQFQIMAMPPTFRHKAVNVQVNKTY